MTRNPLALLLVPLMVSVAACSSNHNKPATASPTVAATRAGTPISLAQTVDGIPCEGAEQLIYHVHAHLTIVANGQPVVVPANIGIVDSQCIYWLHTHDTSGVIHIEAPAARQFTLGTFFDIWRQQLSTTQVLGFTTDAAHSLQFFVDGKPYTGDPRQIPIGPYTRVTIEYGPPFVAPPSYDFPQGL
jgi:hypothetical protein